MSIRKTKPSNRAKISLKNIGRYIQGYSRKLTESFGLLPEYKQEQVVWRTTQAQECLKNGSCLFCGCTTPAKFYSDEACEDPVRKCYPDMMSEQDWNTFKLTNKTKIQIDNA